MAISKIKGGAINDDAISTAKIQNDAVTSPKIIDSYTTALQNNPEFSGTEGARMPNGTTAQRANAQGGDIRFNTTLSLMEYYTGTEWKSIDSPPTVTSLSPTTIVDGTTVTVTGSNFQSGVNVSVIGSDGTTYTPASIVRTNNTTVTFDATAAMISGSLDYFDVKITNASNLSATLENALEITSTHTWVTAAGSLGTIYDAGRTGVSLNAGTTYSGGESDVTVTHSITSGTLPTGLSIAATGVITGNASAVGSDTTTNITVQYSAADTSAGTTVTGTRNFSIIQKTPVVTSYTSTGSGTYSVPVGVSAMDVLLVAGGGSGGSGQYSLGGGGGGGLIYRPAFPVTPGGSVSYTVGGGGTGTATNGNKGSNGQNSTWGTLVTQGGGAGGGFDPGNNGGGPGNGNPGGSGGGGGGSPGLATGNPGSHPSTHPTGQGWEYTGGTASQPQQPGDSATYGFGNAGGTGGHDTGSWEGGGGGGGAAQAGSQGSTNSPRGGNGGNGKAYSISGSSVTYAGGGGGGGNNGGTGGTGGATDGRDSSGNVGGQATANRGSGAGGGHYSPGVTGGSGGSGIIIVSY